MSSDKIFIPCPIKRFFCAMFFLLVGIVLIDCQDGVQQNDKNKKFKASRIFSHAKSDFTEVLSEPSEVILTDSTPVIKITEVDIDSKRENELLLLKDTNQPTDIVIKDQYGNTISEGNKFKVSLDNDRTKEKSIISSVQDILNSEEMKSDYSIVVDNDPDPDDTRSPHRRKRNGGSSSTQMKNDNAPRDPRRYLNISDMSPADLLWISTIEGLTAHFDMMKRFWAFATANKRNLVVASYKSAHYPGVKSVDICAYFELPPNIKCIDVRRNVLVSRFNCTIAPQEHVKASSDYGLSNFSIPGLALVDWASSACVIGTGRSKYFMGRPGAMSHMQIEFSKRSRMYFEEAFRHLFPSSSQVYTAAHWRRSALTHHQPCRYNDRDDEAINCGPPENLVVTVKNVNTTGLGMVYISTNERRPEVLGVVRKEGFKLLTDIRTESSKLSSLDAFVVDLQMMIQANYFMTWGKSAVRSFVERARQQRRIDAEKDRAAAEVEAKQVSVRLVKYRFICIIVVLPVGFVLFLLYAFFFSSKKNETYTQRYKK